MIVRWLSAAAIVVSAALVGLAVWVVGLAGLANRAESICFADLDNRLGYGAFQISRTPGRCRSNAACWETRSIQLMYNTRFQAVVGFGWIVVLPVAYAIPTLALTLRWARQTQRRHDM